MSIPKQRLLGIGYHPGEFMKKVCFREPVDWFNRDAAPRTPRDILIEEGIVASCLKKSRSLPFF
jgi:hypothetical protein